MLKVGKIKSSGHMLLAVALPNELREKIEKIAKEVDAKNQNALCDYIRKVLSNHVVDMELRGVIE